MKRNILALGMGLGLACSAPAQFFLEAYGTYLLPIGGFAESTNNTTNNGTGVSGTKRSELVNFGQGAGGGITLGAPLGEALGWELRTTYVAGTDQEFNSSRSSSYDRRSTTTTYNATYLQLQPALRIRSSGHSINAYIAAGPSIVMAPSLDYANTSVTTYTDVMNATFPISRTDQYTQEFSGGIGWGAFGAVGFTTQGNSAVHFFGELNATAQSWAPKESADHYSSTSINLDGSVSSENETTTTYYEAEFNANETDKSTKIHMPMSTWGLRAGVRFSFGAQHAVTLPEVP